MRHRRYLPAALPAAAASLLAIVQGVATDTVKDWVGGSGWAPWAVEGALLALAVTLQVRASTTGEPGATAAPDELPRDVGDFTGREEELLELQRLIKAGSRTLLISAIDGTPGVGKSTLQIHLAHRVVGRFPDARLYANLRGADDDPEPAEPLAVLEQFLHSLGERRVPRTVEAAAARYRTLLAGKRALILLDNASSEAQVRPLLPGSASCTIVITSRSRLAGLEATHSLTLNVFTDAEAVELLTRIVGVDAVNADRQSTDDVVRFCGRLPLALRIAGSRLKHSPGWTMRDLSARLADERQRLATLASGHLDVRASFQLSYRELTDTEQRLFRLAAVAHTVDLPYEAAARTVGVPLPEARAALDRLIRLHLVESDAAGPGQIHFHDLLRLFAHERSAEQDDDSVRRSALGRVLEWYEEQLTAGAPRRSGWLDQQLENLLALVEQAAGLPAPLRPYAWRLAFALAPHLEEQEELAAWQATAQHAASAAAAAADGTAHAMALANTGRLHEARGEYARARTLLTRAVRQLRSTGGHLPLAQALYRLARVLRQLGELEAAHRAAAEAHRLHRGPAGQATCGPHERTCLIELGDIATARAQHDRAAAHYTAALDGDRAAHILVRLGTAHRALRRYDDAHAAFAEAAQRYQDDGDRAGHATVLEQSGITHDAAGDSARAVTAYRRSQELYRVLRQPADECRLNCNQAISLYRTGRTEEAVAALRDGIRRARRAGAADVESGAQLNLGEILLAEGDTRGAVRLLQQAHESCRRTADTAGRARALHALARAHARSGDASGALSTLHAAVRCARQAHDASLTAGVLIDLGLAHRDRGEWRRAQDHLEDAVRTARSARAPDPGLLGRALMQLGGIESSQGHTGPAARHFARARDHFRAAGEQELQATTLMYLGRLHREADGRHDASAAAYDTAARLWGALDDRVQEARALVCVALAHARLGRLTAAQAPLTRAATLTDAHDASTVERVRNWVNSGGLPPYPDLPW
ncbi:tetratricopeptide repeat protein [Streptomyces bugieae]|uniref:Tetratricopeptide repeat protein n=1 Tax=Streptomyces bugieae TaxID=3098223 RepID=A0ABU7NJF1_9ACTN|nr:tetratricopeptide repeat protein [Streptomyces sp. DSM 41528]